MSADTLQSFNPATGELVGEVSLTPPDRIPLTIDLARAQQKSWGRLSVQQRRAALEPFGAALSRERDSLAELITREMGKPLADACGELDRAIRPWQSYLDEIEQALAPHSIEDKRTITELRYYPLGVAGVITPWNFPFYMIHWMAIPAVMAGNAVILKPSEETPLVGERYAELINESLPPGLFQVIYGDERQGKALVSSDVEMIAFTGSREAGQHIMEASAHTLKRLVLELGGKDPMIVLDDADIEAAAQYAVFNSFRNAGQVCVSTERIYVDDKIMPQFQEALVAELRSQRAGNGLDEGVTLGPMINEKQRAHVLRQIEEAKQQGARVLAGDEQHPPRFINPLILVDVNHEMSIMTEETFGPVACVQSFQTIDQAIQLANDSHFGLGGAVYGKDAERAASVAAEIETGMIGVNQGCYGAACSPWVGSKQSGYGFHSGIDGHRQFAQVRTISRQKVS